MNITHTSIASTDLIMANLSWQGKTFASIAKSHFNSIDEVIRLITTMGGQFFGFAKLTIRNKTQGWSISMPITTPKASPKINTIRTAAAAVPSGTQFALPF